MTVSSSSASQSGPFAAPPDLTSHPLVGNANDVRDERTSPVEHFCQRIADLTGAPAALMLAIAVQVVWLLIGSLTHWDPFPFTFLLTCSNVIQLILIFVIAVAQRQQTTHDEIRAELDHDSISRLLYHQQVQNELLVRLAERTGVDVSDLKTAISNLAGKPA